MLLNHCMICSKKCIFTEQLILSAALILFILDQTEGKIRMLNSKAGLSPLLTRFCCEFRCLLAATRHQGRLGTHLRRLLGSLNFPTPILQFEKFTLDSLLLEHFLCRKSSLVLESLFASQFQPKINFALKCRLLHFPHLEMQ